MNPDPEQKWKPRPLNLRWAHLPLTIIVTMPPRRSPSTSPWQPLPCLHPHFLPLCAPPWPLRGHPSVLLPSPLGGRSPRQVRQRSHLKTTENDRTTTEQRQKNDRKTTETYDGNFYLFLSFFCRFLAVQTRPFLVPRVFMNLFCRQAALLKNIFN